MKKMLKQIIFVSLLAAFFISCKKDETRVSYESGTDPVLTASSTAPQVLLRVNRDQPAISFYWTNPDYKLSTGISSQDVTYTLQVDTVGGEFSSPLLKEKVIAKDLGISLTVSELNLLLSSMKEDVPHEVEIRIKATLNYGSVPLYSNRLTITLTPYLDVVVPLPFTDNLYLIGSAAPGGWDNPVPAATQTFTKTSSTTYEITIPLAGGQQFLVIPDNGSWDNKYAAPAANPPTETGGEFGWNGGNPDFNENFPGPSASGIYKIEFNFKTGKYTVTLQ